MITSLLISVTVAQFCPSYTLSSTNNTHSCGVEAVNGTNPTATQWQGIFNLVAQGPSVWGSAGPSVSDIGQGCGVPNPTVQVPAQFPCELLKAITFQESGWRQFCVPTTPADQVGGPSRTIISFDCGYGIGQVTSGMHIGESPNYDRARVASDPTYNLATGTQILAQKWRATRCVGDNQPRILEHWYSATWAYNGLSTSNNPNNPNFSTTRGVYRPSVGGAAPYQEKVFGWMEFPPTANHWASTQFAYPRLADVGTASSPNTLPDPSCATPTSCANTRPIHLSVCFAGDGGTPMGGGGGSTGGGGGATGGGSATGGGAPTGGGGGSMMTDAGTGGSGGGAGGGSTAPTVVLSAASLTLGEKPPCSCSTLEGALALISLVFLARRRRAS